MLASDSPTDKAYSSKHYSSSITVDEICVTLLILFAYRCHHCTQFRPDDILLVTFPKCGTTWMQEIIWTMTHNLKLDDPATKCDWVLSCPQLWYLSLTLLL